MNYKKLVVMLCLGSHLLVTSEMVFAKKKSRNPFKAIEKILKKADEEVRERLPQIPLPDPIRPIVNPRQYIINSLRPTSHHNNSSVLDAVKNDIEWLKDIPNIHLHSLMNDVRRYIDLNSIDQRLISDQQLISELYKIISHLKRTNNLDLLKFNAPDWEQKVFQRLGPKVFIGDAEVNLLSVLGQLQQQFDTMIKNSDSDLWRMADYARTSAKTILDQTYSSVQNIANAPAAASVGSSEQDVFVLNDWDVYDSLCGYIPVPWRLNSISYLIPVDTLVPAECGGPAAMATGREVIKASEVLAFRLASETDNEQGMHNLARHAKAHTYFKQPYGVVFDFRLAVIVQIPIEPPLQVSVTPHVRFPLAWSKPTPSRRSVSTGGGGSIIKNAKSDRFFFSPEFEFGLLLTPATDPRLLTFNVNVEFPLVSKQSGSGPHGTVLQQIITRVGFDVGLRRRDPNDKLIEETVNSLLKYISILQEDSAAAVRAFEIVTEALELAPEEIAPAEDVVREAAVAEHTLHRIITAIGFMAGISDAAALPSPKLSDSDQADVVTATATMPFLMAGGIGFLKDLGIIGDNNVLFGLTAVTQISLVKLQINFGFLNAHYAAALAKKTLPAANVGFELVRPGVPDWISLSVNVLPQVTQNWYGTPPGNNMVGIQMWGPYSSWAPSVAWAGTLAGSLYLNNGSDQFEPMGVQ